MRADSRTPTHRRGCLWFLLPLVFLLPVALSVFCLTNHKTAVERLDLFAEDLQARGYATSPRELIKVGVPDEENAVVQLLNARDLLDIPRALKPSGRYEPLAVLSPEQKEAMRRAMEEIDPLLDALRKMADCPYFTYMNQDFGRPCHSWDSPNYMYTSGLFRFVFAGASFLATDGSPDRAVEVWKVGVGSSKVFIERPFHLIPYMLGLMTRGMAIDSMDAVFRNREVDSESLREAIRLLDPQNWRENFAVVWDIERAYNFSAGAAEVRAKLPWSLQERPYPREWPKRLLRSSVWALTANQRLNSFIAGQEKMIRLLDILKAPPATWKAKIDVIESEDSAPRHPVTAFFDRFRIPPLRTDLLNLQEDVLEMEMRSQVARTALACKAFRNDRGTWPETLGQLAPDYLNLLPTDLFVDQPLVYRPREDGFLLYSVGADLKDEGGEGGALAWEETNSPTSP